jgi:protein SCO1/2
MRLLMILLMACFVFSCKEKKTGNAVQHKLPFYTTADFTPHWFDDSLQIKDSIHTIPAFHFLDQNGKVVSEKTFDHKIYVADFFFTSCPGICKTLTNNLKLVQAAFENDSTVLILSHSVTPDIDNIERLKLYANNFGVKDDKWFLITGDKNEIYSIARQAYFADEDLGEKKDVNDFLHTENLLLIDKHKMIRGIYKGTSVLQVNDLIKDIKTLEAEE